MSTDVKPHLNHVGSRSYEVTDPVGRLRMMAASCFFGEPMYYQESRETPVTTIGRYTGGSYTNGASTAMLGEVVPASWHGLSPARLIENAIDEALDHDPEATLLEAVRLRQEDNIRATPQVILVRAAHHPKVRGTGLVRKYASQIIRRADEPSSGLAYQLATYGSSSPVPNSLKRAWRAALETYSEYQLAKYRMESRIVKTVDVVNLVHPKSDAVNKLSRGELKLSDETWEAIISRKGSTPEAWAEAIDVMGHMALLRNLRNVLTKSKVSHRDLATKLVAGAPTGRQLPFRYYAAHTAISDIPSTKQVRDAIEESMMLSLGNLPHLKGRTMALADNSGSAQGVTTSSMGSIKISTIGNLTAILAAMISDSGEVGVFGDKLFRKPIDSSESPLASLDDIESTLTPKVGQGTENGIWIFLRDALANKEHWDNIFVFSDMQAGHGGLYGHSPAEYKKYRCSYRSIDVPKLIAEYRQTVNPDVRVFLVQIAGQRDTIVPEFYDKTYILGGWSDSLLKFAAAMSEIK